MGKITLEVKCSPGTIKRIETNAEYQQEVLAQLFLEEPFDEVRFSPSQPGFESVGFLARSGSHVAAKSIESYELFGSGCGGCGAKSVKSSTVLASGGSGGSGDGPNSIESYELFGSGCSGDGSNSIESYELFGRGCGGDGAKSVKSSRFLGSGGSGVGAKSVKSSRCLGSGGSGVGAKSVKSSTLLASGGSGGSGDGSKGIESYEVFGSDCSGDGSNSVRCDESFIGGDSTVGGQEGLNDLTKANKNEWLNAPVKLLISLVKELRPQVGKTTKLKNKKKMWISISEKLCSQGYMFTAQQVETKYYTLERAYKNNRLHNSKTGRNRETIPFQEELDDLLSVRKGINPEFRLNEDDSAGLDDIQSDDLNSTSTTTTDESFPEKPRGRKRNFQKELIEKIEDIVESSKTFQSKTLEILQQREERVKQRQQKQEERFIREEARKKRKMEILETVIAKNY